jgi:hypothetical protein
VLQALRDPPITVKINHFIFYIRKLYTELVTNNKNITFLWVPSHLSIHGNEVADLAAKEASTKVIVANFSIPTNDCNISLKSNINLSWTQQYNLSTIDSIKWFHKIAPIISTINKKKWFEIIKLSRHQYTSLFRLRSGHSKIPDHLCKLKIINSNICTLCGNTPADLNHLFLLCPVTHFARTLWLSDVSKLNHRSVLPPRSLTELLFSSPPGYLTSVVHRFAKFLYLL